MGDAHHHEHPHGRGHDHEHGICCDGADTRAEQASEAQREAARYSFDVQGLDCAEEVALLKREVGAARGRRGQPRLRRHQRAHDGAARAPAMSAQDDGPARGRTHGHEGHSGRGCRGRRTSAPDSTACRRC
ncbi:MAG: hypothetical protein U5K43_07165 [Halofilum sp. (in: g-proteobacteria)]|nr:hypothetical protein [Halofilum sp. (in: g-proteobacteria)]